LRKCGDCTECCRTLKVRLIDENYVSKCGQYCKYVKKDKGCSVWDSKLSRHCKLFTCGWLANEAIPEKFKPNKCGVVIKYESDNFEKGFARYWCNERDYKNAKKSMKELLKIVPTRETMRNQIIAK
tara:strand:+ start:27 stop:404 length:378 start_codon:yes stop_codon:yes gene_type:complete